MDINNIFGKKDTLTEELRMLPRETKKRILENVNRRRNAIIEEKLLEKQLKGYDKPSKKDKRTFGQFKEGMQNRRKELQDKGIIQPLIRYNKENFTSPMEEASKRARAAEIKRLEDQRNKLKSGSLLESNSRIKLKDLKLKIPESDSPFSIKKKLNKKTDYLKDGII